MVSTGVPMTFRTTGRGGSKDAFDFFLYDSSKTGKLSHSVQTITIFIILHVRAPYSSQSSVLLSSFLRSTLLATYTLLTLDSVTLSVT